MIGAFVIYLVYQKSDSIPTVVSPPAVIGTPSAGQPTPEPPSNLAPTSVTPSPTPVPPPPAPAPKPIATYKNGQYLGNVVDAYYGNVQVKAIISGGRLTDVQWLDYPQDRQRSLQISQYAMPILTSEAVQAQSAQVDIVSGATSTSGGFQASLASALAKAKA